MREKGYLNIIEAANPKHTSMRMLHILKSPPLVIERREKGVKEGRKPVSQLVRGGRESKHISIKKQLKREKRKH